MWEKNDVVLVDNKVWMCRFRFIRKDVDAGGYFRFLSLFFAGHAEGALHQEQQAEEKRRKRKKPGEIHPGFKKNMVPRDRIELPTRGFSVPCSTN